MADGGEITGEAVEQSAAEAGASGMTPAELAEAKEYGRLSFACDLADKLLDIAFLALVAFVFATPLYDWLAESFATETVRLVMLFLITTLAHAVVSFPLSLYAGYTLEHRFGLSHLSLAGWMLRYFKRNVLALAFGLVMVPGLYAVIWLVGQWWWLAAAGIFFLVAVVLGQLTPVLILPLFYKIERLDNADLALRMSRLAEGTGLSIRGVYRLGLSAETAKANAMLAGVGRTRRVLMGDTLLDQFSGDEIEVIFAHEIGHHVFRHIPKMIATGLVYSVAGMWVCDRMLMWWAHRQFGDISQHDLPASTLPLLMLVLTLFGVLLEPLQNIISRRYERQCDRYALERTGLREAYVSAFRKLARLNKDDPEPHPVEVFLFHSHPPINERLAIAEK